MITSSKQFTTNPSKHFTGAFLDLKKSSGSKIVVPGSCQNMQMQI